MAALHQYSGVSITELTNIFKSYSRRTIQRHAKKAIGEKAKKKTSSKGRPRKVTDQDRRAILRCMKALRRTDGANFTSGRIKVAAGVEHLSNRTVRRVLNQAGYRYLQARRKGLLTAADLKKRVKFCKKVKKRNLGSQFWREGISFYLDGKGFQYKTNPHVSSNLYWLNFSSFSKKKKKENNCLIFITFIGPGKSPACLCMEKKIRGIRIWIDRKMQQSRSGEFKLHGRDKLWKRSCSVCPIWRIYYRRQDGGNCQGAFWGSFRS